MAKFIVIGERIHCISPTIRQAMETMTPEPILQRAKEQLDAGATYLDVNIGPAEKNGPELMQWVFFAFRKRNVFVQRRRWLCNTSLSSGAASSGNMSMKIP